MDIGQSMASFLRCESRCRNFAAGREQHRRNRIVSMVTCLLLECSENRLIESLGLHDAGTLPSRCRPAKHRRATATQPPTVAHVGRAVAPRERNGKKECNRSSSLVKTSPILRQPMLRCPDASQTIQSLRGRRWQRNGWSLRRRDRGLRTLSGFLLLERMNPVVGEPWRANRSPIRVKFGCRQGPAQVSLGKGRS